MSLTVLPCCGEAVLKHSSDDGVARRLGDMVVFLMGAHQADLGAKPIRESMQCVVDVSTGLRYDIDWGLFWFESDRRRIPVVNPMETIAKAASK